MVRVDPGPSINESEAPSSASPPPLSNSPDCKAAVLSESERELTARGHGLALLYTIPAGLGGLPEREVAAAVANRLVNLRNAGSEWPKVMTLRRF